MFFATIFNIECVLKLYALHEKYFEIRWNQFDFLCVFATNVGLILTLVFELQIGAVLSLIRFLRIARLFRIVRFLKGLNALFTALILSIPKLLNVGIVLCLLLFLYSVLGVALFGKVTYYREHNEHANFRNFLNAFVTLSRSMTGEAWNEIMHDLSKDKEFFEGVLETHCVPSLNVNRDNYNELVESGLISYPTECGSFIG